MVVALRFSRAVKPANRRDSGPAAVPMIVIRMDGIATVWRPLLAIFARSLRLARGAASGESRAEGFPVKIIVFPDASSISSEGIQMDFSVEVGDLVQNPFPADPGGDASYKNTTGTQRQAWTNADNQEFWYAEACSFVNNLNSSLGGYQVKVAQRSGARPTGMLLSCGNQTVVMKGDADHGWNWWLGERCPVTTGNIGDYLQTLANTGSQGVVQMTLQPFDGSDPQNSVGQGYRSVLVSIGPQNYASGGRTRILASQLPAAAPADGQGDLWIGGLAQYLIRNRLDPTADYELVVDREIGAEGALSAAVVLNTGASTTTNGVLDLSGKWSVFGTHRVNGYSAYQKGMNWPSEAERIACTGLLDLSTGYEADPANDDYAIDVAGLTFAYPGKRNQGTVQLNCWDTYDWSGDSYQECVASLRRNLAAGNAKRRARSARKGQNELGPVKVFDTRIIGGWIDGSDGIETMGPGSLFDRNFIHTCDDSIKLRAPGIRYLNTTVWQGNAGAAINPGAYGYVNQYVDGSIADGVFIHRVTQRFDPDTRLAQGDDLGALISNRTGFSNNFFLVANGTLGLNNVTVRNLYVPSLRDQSGKDANSISRVIVLSAINPGATGARATRTGFYPRPTEPLGLEIDNFKMENISVNFEVSPKKELGYSKGMICVGDFKFAALQDGWNGPVNYVTGDGTAYQASLRIDPVDYQDG